MTEWTEHIHTNAIQNLHKGIEHVDFQYEYPEGLNLHPKTKLHKFIVNQVLERAQEARNLSSQSFGEWGKLDWALTAYVPATEAESKIKKKDARKPVNIIVPQMLSSLEVYLTYMGGVVGDPIHRYVGRGDKRSKVRGAMLERVISTQNKWFKERLHLRTLFRDAFVYGVGIVSPVWRKTKARRRVAEEMTEIAKSVLKEMGKDIKQDEFLRYMEEVVLMEGNSLRNIDPYQVLLDPNVSAYDFQDSEYFGYLNKTNAMQLLRNENDPEENLFNCRYVHMLAEQNGGNSAYRRDDSSRSARWDTGTDTYFTASFNTTAVDIIHMYIDLIPADWGIGDEDYPVKWEFAVAGDQVLIQAHPLDLDHGQYPAVIITPNSTGYDMLPVSHLATCYGMQQTIDFFVQSHVANVRKAINGMLIVDPSVVDMNFLRDDPDPGGRIIPVRQTAYGTGGLHNYIDQLAVMDVTRGHMSEAQVFMDLMGVVLGTKTPDLSRAPERPTATGFASELDASSSRLREIASNIYEQGLRDLAFQEAFNTQKLMSQAVVASITGRYESLLKTELGINNGVNDYLVAPGDIETSFEVEAMTLDSKTENLSTISEVVKTALGVPGAAIEVFRELDLSRIVIAWLRKAGFDDVQEFLRQAPGMDPITAQVMSNEQIQQQAQAGNIVPTGEYTASV